MLNLQRSLAIALLAVLALSTPAHAATLYQIDLVVFARPGGDREEQSVTANGLQYPTRLALLQTASEDATMVGPWQLIPKTARVLNDEAAALARRGYPILFQGAWRQSIDTATRATSVAIAGGRSVGDRHELQGYITVSAENYLHVYVNLWFSQFGPTPPSTDPIVLPRANGDLAGVGIPAGNTDAEPSIEKLFVLQQHRRVRSGELHYFDHPRFSALVTINPVESPTE